MMAENITHSEITAVKSLLIPYDSITVFVRSAGGFSINVWVIGENCHDEE